MEIIENGKYFEKYTVIQSVKQRTIKPEDGFQFQDKRGYICNLLISVSFWHIIKHKKNITNYGAVE